MRVYSIGVYVPKESYTLNIKKSRKTLAQPLNRNQNNIADLKKKISPLIWRKNVFFSTP